jgi:signal transduction histidine kinase
MSRFAPFLFGLLAVAIVLGGVFLADKRGKEDFQRDRVLDHLGHAQVRLTNVLHDRLHLVEGLAAFVKSHPDIPESEFQKFALALEGDLPGIRSLQLAPDAVVKYMTHPETNKAALGHDLLADPARSGLVQNSIDERQYLIAGPVELIQGGTALIGRWPIYRSDPGGSGDRFWGFASILLDLEPLLAEAGLTGQSGEVAYALRGKDAMGARGEVFFGDPAAFEGEPSILEVPLPNGSWQLAGVAKPGWPGSRPGRLAFWISGGALSLAIGLLLFILLRRPQRLRAAVDEATEVGEALKVAKIQAEKANAAKSRFLAAANHDLRQPLQSLGLHLASLERAGEHDRRHILTHEMPRALDAMASLMNGLLDIGKLESGELEFEIREFPADEVIDRVVREYAYQASSKGLEFRVVRSGVTLRSDPVLLERIVGNLVDNAVRYTHHGKVLVGCRVCDESVRIEVWDSGVGIAPAERSMIFEQYYQLDNPARNSKKGLGIGLSVARGLADLLGHAVDLRSTVGRGSVFSVEVPRGRTRALRRVSGLVVEAEAPNLSDRTVVIVEDNESVLRATSMLVGAWGAKVVPTVDEEEALIFLRGAAPDFILADYRLGGGRTGVEVAKNLRRTAGFAVPTLIITGDTDPSVTREIEAAGYPVIQKPIEPDHLKAEIEKRLLPPAPPQSDLPPRYAATA